MKRYLLLFACFIALGGLTNCNNTKFVDFDCTVKAKTFYVYGQIKKEDLIVTAKYSDNTTKEVTDYTTDISLPYTFTINDLYNQKTINVNYNNISKSITIAPQWKALEYSNFQYHLLTLCNDDKYTHSMTYTDNDINDVTFSCNNPELLEVTSTTSGEVSFKVKANAKPGMCYIIAKKGDELKDICAIYINNPLNDYLAFHKIEDNKCLVELKYTEEELEERKTWNPNGNGIVGIPSFWDFQEDHWIVDGFSGGAGEQGAFENCKALKQIIIPDTITTIDENAFCNCSNLEYLYVPHNVESIDENAFASCSNLKYVNMSNSQVKAINTNAFAGCYDETEITGLTAVSFPNTIISIFSEAFTRCPLLKYISIPSDSQLTSI